LPPLNWITQAGAPPEDAFWVVVAAIHGRILGPVRKSAQNLADQKRRFRIYRQTRNKSDPRSVGLDRRGEQIMAEKETSGALHNDRLTVKQPIHLKIIHRNRIFRECLATVLSGDDRFHVVPVDHTDADELAAVEQQRPDVVLIDLNLPDQLALELTHHVRERVDSARVILLTHGNAEEDLAECFQAGAQGCILEESSLDDLRTAIDTVAAGGTFCPPKMVHSMLSCLAHSAREAYRREQSKPIELTPRELEVLRLIEDHLSNKQIACKLSRSLYTVKNHVHNIIEKLKVCDRFQAVEYAHRRRWLTKSRLPGSWRQDN
jgi:DNA-binding NarL/FixJ family response regulator